MLRTKSADFVRISASTFSALLATLNAAGVRSANSCSSAAALIAMARARRESGCVANALSMAFNSDCQSNAS